MKGLVPALIVKHTLMVIAVVTGALMWRRMAKVAGLTLAEADSGALADNPGSPAARGEAG